MKVTVLIENTSDSELLSEHGLSLLISHAGKQILLDAGTTDAFAKNAKAMQIDLRQVDACVLSHGHYDHAGGFAAFFRENDHAKLYARETIAKTYLSAKGGMHEIGVPKEVLAYAERIEMVTGVYPLKPGLLVPHTAPHLEQIGERAGLYRMEAGKLFPDDFAHEQSLVFDTEEGLVVFNSCSHGGIGNILAEVKAACPGRPVRAFFGGLHMKGRGADGAEICTFSDAELDILCDAIRKEPNLAIYTGHCTGDAALRKLQSRLKERVHVLTTGMQVEL